MDELLGWLIYAVIHSLLSYVWQFLVVGSGILLFVVSLQSGRYDSAMGGFVMTALGVGSFFIGRRS